MFLDRELGRIAQAKDILGKRCAMRRLMLQLDALAIRAKAAGAISGLKAGLAAAGLIRNIMSNHKGRKC